MVFIYILELKSNKYYVGKTSNPKFRLSAHFNMFASSWTKKYRPVDICQLIPNCDDEDEDKYTIRYMKKYGIDNVRGGTFCQIKLPKRAKKFLEKMICGSSDKCYCCGRSGHFAKDCHMKNRKEKVQKCCRCSRIGHLEKDCYAGTTVNGNMIEESDDECYRCGRSGHFANNCYARTDIDGYRI